MRLLLAEDDPYMATLETSVLQENGYEPTVVGDGAQALCRFQRSPFPIVLTDLVMPVMDGPALIAALHLQYPAIKIVTMSGLLDGAPPAEPAAPDAQAWLSKPFSATQLLTKLHSVLAT